jgi:ubiquinone/menaquinone biosynthesis C-methylase UbiE
MLTPSLVLTILRETFSSERSPRVPEPDLIMDDPEKVRAFREAGAEDGIMASVYLYHCAQISEVIKPGDTVVDLGCGPANQLGIVARYNPESHFIGVDLSDEMLECADRHLQSQNIPNVALRKADISRLDGFGDASVDAVFSTVVLHHLPTTEHLLATFSNIARILKPGGGLYLVDFSHLKSEKSIEYFAYRGQTEQPELFTIDYLHSLRAAFPLSDIKQAYTTYLATFGHLYVFSPMPYMVAVKSAPRRVKDLTLEMQLRQHKNALPSKRLTDLKDIMSLFRLSGLRSQYLE